MRCMRPTRWGGGTWGNIGEPWGTLGNIGEHWGTLGNIGEHAVGLGLRVWGFAQVSDSELISKAIEEGFGDHLCTLMCPCRGPDLRLQTVVRWFRRLAQLRAALISQLQELNVYDRRRPQRIFVSLAQRIPPNGSVWLMKPLPPPPLPLGPTTEGPEELECAACMACSGGCSQRS